ncbi:MAG TPA: glycosyltransferase family 4 protein [Blastocatellia bacterium]|nr:glycosyltransferase family 4 protein [Blastocatellia bacterium]
MKLAIVATHPIQYQVPWFQELAKAESIQLKVYYALIPTAGQQGTGFGVSFTWDLPLLEGYEWELLTNDRAAPSLGTFSGLSTRGIYSVLKRDRPDAVIITGWNSLPLIQALWACVRLRIPRIVRGESSAIRTRTIAARIAHRALLSRFNAYLAIGKANRDFYLGNGVSPDRIFTTRYFVDNRRFESQRSALEPERIAIRAGWNIPSGYTCFLFAGKLIPKKRILDLVKALEIARRETPSIHLLVAGSGEQIEEAQALTGRLRLPVTFAGFLNQTEISRAYVAADCLVLPSDYDETWGLVVNEAMASGLPAIVSDRVGCGPDLIEAGATGWVFPFGDTNALAASLAGAASDSGRLRRMGEQAKALISRYSVQQAVQGTIEAVESVTRRTSAAQLSNPKLEIRNSKF